MRWWIAAGIAAVAGYVGVIVFSPLIREPRQPLQPREDAEDVPGGTATPSDDVEQHETRFRVGGEEVAASLYLPRDRPGPVACIVMNNGIGATRRDIVEPYARRFCEAGFAALTYDYRHFGESEGQPRQLYHLDRQVEDCQAAVAFVRALPEVDAERVAVWGTSAAGGYGLVVAAEDERIACVACQCASLDHAADTMRLLGCEGAGYVFRLFLHAARDRGRGRLGLSAHHIPIFGRPGTTALLPVASALEGCARVVHPGYVNAICARALLTPHGRTATDVVDELRCPVLLQICEKDEVVSLPGSLAVAERLGPLAEVRRYPIGHFDVYLGDHFERSVTDQVAFFARYLEAGRRPDHAVAEAGSVVG